MGWWSAQCNDFTKSWSPLVELANTTKSVKGSSKRGIIIQAREGAAGSLLPAPDIAGKLEK
jgi:hypothetical protein